MFSQLRSYNVKYLMPFREDVTAIEDKKAPGFYHHKALMVGESERAIVMQIREKGGLPISMTLARPRPKLFNGMDREYKQQFLKAIYFNSSAMSAAKALEAVIESDNSSLRSTLNPALMIVKRGGTFMEAIDSIGAFDESTLAIIEAGERMGTLKASIETAVQHLASSAMTNKAMIGIAIGASIEISIALTSLLGNRYGMLPTMVENIPENASPAVVEQIKNAVAHGILFNDIMIYATFLCFIAGIIGAYAYFDSDKKFRRWVDNRVMSIPALGQVIIHTAVANSFKVAASLIEGGVHLSTAMTIALKSSRVPRVTEYWEKAIKSSEVGDSVAESLAQPLLDNADRVLIKSHKEARDLAESFRNIAEKRMYMAGKAAKRFARILFMGMAIYTTAAVASSLYVMWIQNSSLLSEMK